MATMDIFRQNAFSMRELTMGLKSLPYRPSLLRTSGLFTPKPQRMPQGSIELIGGTLTLIPFSQRGTPAAQGTGDARKLVEYSTRHFKKQDKIYASEVAGIREFGSETEMKQAMTEVANRGQKVRNDAELTFEYHMLNAVQGMVKNTDGTEIYNWYTLFGISEEAEIDFDLDNASPPKGALRKKCTQVVNSIEDSLGDLGVANIEVSAICGSTFWEQLTSHPDVIEAWLNAAKLAELSGKAPNTFDWGGIRWRRYRGGSGVTLDATKCRIYPSNVPDLFPFATSPAQTFEFVNTPGEEVYYRMIFDQDRGEWVAVELESNPMFICSRPQALRKGRNT